MSSCDSPLGNVAAEMAVRWVVRLTSGEMTENEMRQFQIWLNDRPQHEDEFRIASRLWAGLPPEALGDRGGPEVLIRSARLTEVTR